MPAAVLLRLRPVEPATGSVFLGPVTADWFAGQTRTHAPDLPLDGAGGVPAYALGVLPGAAGSDSITLRIAALDGRLADALGALLPDPGATLDLGEARYVVDAVARTAAQHPLAGAVSWDTLAAPLFAGDSLPDRANRPAFQIVSPAFFESYDPDAPDQLLRPALPFPLPELVFGSLVTRWNAFAPTVLPAEVRDYAEACLAVQEARLQTRWERVGTARRTGCTGLVRYVVTRPDPYWQAPLAVLAAFAPYAGIGSWTHLGFGQVTI